LTELIISAFTKLLFLLNAAIRFTIINNIQGVSFEWQYKKEIFRCVTSKKYFNIKFILLSAFKTFNDITIKYTMKYTFKETSFNSLHLRSRYLGNPSHLFFGTFYLSLVAYSSYIRTSIFNMGHARMLWYKFIVYNRINLLFKWSKLRDLLSRSVQIYLRAVSFAISLPCQYHLIYYISQ